MAMNLTNQACSIAQVAEDMAGGDLAKKIEVDMPGEILELKETVNGTTESLSVFADEVTRVAGGGQASREGDGCWRHLEGSNG